MEDDLKQIIIDSSSLFNNLYDFVATSLTRESLSKNAQQKRKALAHQLGDLIEKLRNDGHFTPASASYNRPRMETPHLGAKPPLSLQHRQPPPPPPANPPDDEPELYTDMQADQNGGVVGEMEEFYTDMGTGSAAPPPPRTPPPPNDAEALQEETYTDMGASEQGGEAGPIEEEFYTDMGGNAVGGVAPSIQVEEEDVYHDVTSSSSMASPPPDSDNVKSGTSLSVPDDDSPYAHVKKVKKIKAASLTSVAKQCGYLEKLGGYRGKSWQKRFCILDDICLYFFGSDKDKAQHNQLLLVRRDVAGDVPELKLKDKKKDLVFKVHPTEEEGHKDSKTYYFRATDSKSKEDWIMALAGACHRGANLLNRHTILREYVDQPSPTTKHRSFSAIEEGIPDEDGEALYEDAATTTTTTTKQPRPITPSFTSESETDSPAVSKRLSPAPAPATLRPQSHFIAPSNPALSSALSTRPKSQFAPPSTGGTSRFSPDPVVDTSRIYHQDKWFNYDDVYVAAWNCAAGGADELGLRRGDLVLVVERKNTDWWFCTAESGDDDFRGKSGLVPASYLAPAFELA